MGEAYNKSSDDVIKELGVTAQGITSLEAQKRRITYGYNVLNTENKISKIKIFIDQFKDFIIYILLFATFFSILAKEYIDAGIILFILLVNAIIGFWQEYSSQKSLEALKKMTHIKANVLRNGHIIKIDSQELVPGDVLVLEAGDIVPADARIISCVRLKVQESALTGESVPVDKISEKISGEKILADRKNMLYSSTLIAEGNCRALVVSTGMKTEIGKITSMIKEAKDEQTPLQRRLDSFGKKLGIAIIAICLIVFGMLLIQHGINIETVLLIEFALIAISLAVAAVPTALPVVVTVALSLGVKKLLKKDSLVRQLRSVETLGSCDVICTDKTGTLTKNEMTVRNVWTLNGDAKIEGLGYEPKGIIDNKLNPLIYQIGLACNDASLYQEKNKWKITGDPTEAALLVSAAKAGIKLDSKRLDELPFDSTRKLMSVLVKEGKKHFVYTKGAPDQILKSCKYVLYNNKKVKLSDKHKSIIKKQIDDYSKKAMRVLAFSYKEEKKLSEKELIFVGLQAMIDPPRAEVIESIKKTKEAGIRTIMITGDYAVTAKAIANEIGIEGKVLTGEDLNKMSDKELVKALKNDTNIFARVIPEHKQKIVDALQKMNHTVAMTGDGVNDAPALKKANIGVAVGSGTEVAKEASDFVLLDDSFATIVDAVEEGRGIYENIQKSIMLLLSGNLGEVLIIFLAILFGFNLPLTAILLLWINMVTDGAPALAYSRDPYGQGIMKKKPRPHNEPILPWNKLMFLFFLGLVGTAIALFLFWMNGGNSSVEKDIMIAQTMVFNFVVLYEMILTFSIRRGYDVKTFSNFWLYLAVLSSVVLQAVLMYTPLNEVFGIVSLDLYHIEMLMIAGLVFFVAGWLYHFIERIILKQRNKSLTNPL